MRRLEGRFPRRSRRARASWSSRRPTARGRRRGACARRSSRRSRATRSRSTPREDIVVPLDRLAEAIEETVAIGRRHDLTALSWGHAGDGNLHSSFLVSLDDPAELARAVAASEELFALAVRLGGSISGEHGIGSVKRDHLGVQWPERALALQRELKRVFDPKGLMNPGKKV